MPVAGFDDPEWFSFWDPPITTVAMDLNRLSQENSSLIVAQENGQS
jgi:DNA-binding LacI/PurR family transcriptional regulator